MYDKASLALIPSGTKASKLYSVLPANGNGDFDHTRGSTATRVNKDGLIESVAADVPRLDYPLTNGVVGDCPHLLLEPQRTNLVTYSEDFSDSSWVNVNTTETSSTTTSPNGTLNTYKLTKSAANGLIRTFISVSGDYTFSVFLKKDTLNYARLFIASAVESASVYINLDDGSTGTEIGNPDGVKVEYYGNGWYKCSINKNVSTITNFRIYPADGDNDISGTSGSIFIYGAQVEQGSYATSYIPTSGSTVSRSRDVCDSAGTSAEFNDSEGVLFAEMAALANDSTNRYIAISDGTINNNIVIRIGSNNKVLSRLFRSGSPVGSAITDASTDTTTNIKVAIVYNNTNHSFFVNGTKIGNQVIDSSYSLGTLNRLNFNDGNNSSIFYGKVKQLIYFNEALSDIELETLTS